MIENNFLKNRNDFSSQKHQCKWGGGDCVGKGQKMVK